MLGVVVPDEQPLVLLWFRAECPEVVNWAVNPHKPVEPGLGPGMLNPRASFELWRETVHGRSRPWTKAETVVAERFRDQLIKISQQHRGEELNGMLQQKKGKLKETYRKLLESTSRVVGQAKRFAQDVTEGIKYAADPQALDGLREEIETMVPRVKQVMKQTRARIFQGDTRSEGKIFSIFEPSTEIIRKGKAGKPNEFGKVVKIQESDQIVVDYEVYDQRPSDSDVLIPAIQAHQPCLTVHHTS